VAPLNESIDQAMSEYFIRKLKRFYDLEEALAAAFESLFSDRRDFPADTYFGVQDGEYKGIFLIENGWVIRSKTLESGARQIVNVAVPGDFIGLNAILFTNSDFDLVAKTPVQAYYCDPDRLLALMQEFPSFAAALFWVSVREESILAERVVSLGRRSAAERTAHILCELVARLEVAGIEDFSQIIMPVSQNDFADILGMSLVHMNKTLRGLEADGVISFRNELLTIQDMSKLLEIAGFQGEYVYFADRKDRKTRIASM